jgi:hypothetical protein
MPEEKQQGLENSESIDWGHPLSAKTERWTVRERERDIGGQYIGSDRWWGDHAYITKDRWYIGDDM